MSFRTSRGMGLRKQVQLVCPSSPLSALVRFRLHIWPTVSTYLCKSLSLQQGWFMFTFYCPSKVQTAYLAYCRNLLLPG